MNRSILKSKWSLMMEDMAVLRVQFMHDIKAILTPKQTAMVKAKHMNRENRRGEHRRIRESMLDTWLNTPAEEGVSAP